MNPSIHVLCVGRQSAKSWSTSIKIADKTSANLGDWIKKQCRKLGDDLVGQAICVWLPAKRQKKLAIVKSYNSKDSEHLLKYQDDSEEVLYLAVESYMLKGEQHSTCRISTILAVCLATCFKRQLRTNFA